MSQQIADELNVTTDFDAAKEIERRVAFLAATLTGTGARALILGISGGVDSSTAGRLCRLAVDQARDAGHDARFIAMRLPYGVQRDEADAQAALAFTQADRVLTVDVRPAADAALQSLVTAGLTTRDEAEQDFVLGNIKARERMIAQYAVASATNENTKRAGTMGAVQCGIAVSVDGFVAGPNQSLANPFGEGVGGHLHRWMFERPEENAAELEALNSGGAYVMGRNMFGPGREAWDETWQGWWGDNPPYHAPVFVLTHHPRKPVTMQGGTTFTFVTDGIHSALAQARAAAGDKHVGIMGGAATINQYLKAGLIDELRLHVVPVTLGAGERLFEGVGGLTLEPISSRTTELVTHLKYRVVHDQ